jgi:hypothetical protein
MVSLHSYSNTPNSQAIVRARTARHSFHYSSERFCHNGDFDSPLRISPLVSLKESVQPFLQAFRRASILKRRSWHSLGRLAAAGYQTSAHRHLACGAPDWKDVQCNMKQLP